MTLRDFFAVHPRAALGFSGGVDSGYLLWAARDAGAEVRPYFVKTPFQPAFALRDALALGKQLGVAITVLELELPQPVMDNPRERCYRCKKVLFGALRSHALADGYDLLLEGSNASEDPAARSGMRALEELEVLSPLRMCGLTRPEIRARSQRAGLLSWDRPGSACLATRFPTGTVITREKLRQVEAAEEVLRSLGLRDVQVRIFRGAARLQAPEDQMARLLGCREGVLGALKQNFTGVMLDLEGRP